MIDRKIAHIQVLRLVNEVLGFEGDEVSATIDDDGFGGYRVTVSSSDVIGGSTNAVMIISQNNDGQTHLDISRKSSYSNKPYKQGDGQQ